MKHKSLQNRQACNEPAKTGIDSGFCCRYETSCVHTGLFLKLFYLIIFITINI
jgi:hypothetical protein